MFLIELVHKVEVPIFLVSCSITKKITAKAIKCFVKVMLFSSYKWNHVTTEYLVTSTSVILFVSFLLFVVVVVKMKS